MRSTLMVAALLALPVAAGAQTPPPGGRGPLVVERLENRFVLAPDFKVTEIDGDTGQLAGGYAGWLAEDQLLVGGAGYWLANGPDDAELVYGGLIVGWSTPAEHRIQFGARGLVGAGRATLGTELTRFARFGSRGGTRPGAPEATTVTFRAQDDFIVFEPQLALVTKVTDRLSVSWGVGYRLTGFTDILNDRVRGYTGSVALQFGGW